MNERMPTIFFGHGNPMNALLTNRFTQGWRAMGAAIPRPKGILSISAHWYVPGVAVTTMTRPRTIHDFGGFPPALSQVRYPAPGAPELAARVQQLLAPLDVIRDESWGLDHGTWSVLTHIFPDADIPVVQLSIHALQPLAYHLELGARLARLRERGVLIIGSGNVVHNLGLIDWRQPEAAFDWSQRFDDDVKAVMTSAPADILKLAEHPDYPRAVPTPEHFLPLLYLAGLAGNEPVRILTDGYAMGSLSMTAYGLNLPS